MNIFRKILHILSAAPGLRRAWAIVACAVALGATAQSTPFDIDVVLDSSIEISSEQGLIMYLERDKVEGAPTLVQIKDGDITLGYAHFQYRGPKTHEFSDPIYYEGDNKTVSNLKVTVLKVERPASNDNTNSYNIKFYPYKKGDLYPDGRKDPLRYGTDYYTGFYNFTYESNRGILNERNHYDNNWTYPKATPWGEDNTFVYRGDVYELPTFNKQGGGQMPHVTEHTLYAMPGDIISLSPYYDLPLTSNYMEKFSHWYGYNPRNDNDELQDQDYHRVVDSKGNRLLDFLIDPADMIITDKAGYFAGSKFPKISAPNETFLISTPEALNSFANFVNSGQETVNAILVADIDCTDKTMTKIGGVYNSTLKRNISYRGKFDGNGYTIKNYTLKESAKNYNTGVFGGVGGGVEICNLKVENAEIEAGGFAGVLVGRIFNEGLDDNANINIQNVFVQGNVTNTATKDSDSDSKVNRAGGIIGSAINNEEGNKYTITLDKVAFVGNVKGGYSNTTLNAALIGCTEGHNVNIKDCYADAFVQYATDGMCAVANVNQEGKTTIDNLTVENSYIEIKTTGEGKDPKMPVHITQNYFTNLDVKVETVNTQDDTKVQEIFSNIHYIGTSTAGWNNMCIWMWWGGNKGNVFTQPYWPDAWTKWPGKPMKKVGNNAYAFFSDEEWNRLFVHDDLWYIFNKDNGTGSNTGNKQFPAYGEDNYYFETPWSENPTTPAPQLDPIVFDRTVFVRNDFGNKYFMDAHLQDGTTRKFISQDSYIKDDEEGAPGYSIFYIPDDWSGTYNVYQVENGSLPHDISNPIGKPSGKQRIYVKFAPDIKWDEYWYELRVGDNSTEEWTYIESNKLTDYVKIDNETYYFLELSKYEDKTQTWDISFHNGEEGPECEKYETVIRNMTLDMILEVHSAGIEYEGKKIAGIATGALFDPRFFDYNTDLPKMTAPLIPNLDVKVFEIDGQKYKYINLGIPFENKSQFTFDISLTDMRNESTSQYMAWGGGYLIWYNSDYITNCTYLNTYKTDPLESDNAFPENSTSHFIYPALYAESLANGLELWKANESGYLIPPMETKDVKVSEGEPIFETPTSPSHEARWYGTEATFYQPYKTEFAPSADENLYLDNNSIFNQREYHIAADFGHDFNDYGDGFNIDHEGKTIHEPVVNFRHIFHIKDGKTFADNYTSSKEDNENYIKNNSRAVSARAGHDFQIRLNQQVPRYKEGQSYSFTRTNFYYKKGENEYERVPRVGIEVRDSEGNTINNQEMFTFDAAVETQGSRKYPVNADFVLSDADYYTANGGGEIWRAIYCKADDANAGTYTVRLKALDFDGNDIKIYETDAPLYLDEYVITFLDEQSASLLTEEALKTNEEYRTHRTEYLEQEDVCGPPAVVVDFDQYRVFEDGTTYNYNDYFLDFTGNPNTRTFKWPLTWQESTYSFAYGEYKNCDYNEYTITNHSSQTRYHAAANNLYDRLYYDTDNEEMGYFYYVNAASDPGVSATLKIHHLCPGSTVVVSAWIAEMSLAQEVANLCFNFVAVDSDGNHEIVHSFVTGYIDDFKGNQEARKAYYENNNKTMPGYQDNNGKWMHVYYSFIPDLSSIQNLTTIDHYELELENNCMSSEGADYAVDDIRAYIISPAITARQLSPVCDPSQKTVGIRVSSRFDKVLESNGLTEATDENETNDVTLNFAVLDKKKYDTLYEHALKNIEEGGILSPEVLTNIVDESNIQMNGKEFTTVTISNFFEKMKEYDEKTYSEALRYTSEASGVRFVRVNIIPEDEDLRPGKDYYIVLSQIQNPSLSDFAITDDPCQKFAVMTLQGSGIIKIDGIAYNSGEPVDVCIGQRPVVQVELQMLKDGKELTDYDAFKDAESHYYDWFVGSIEEFMAKDNNVYSYYDLLDMFRYGNTPDNQENGDWNTEATELPEAEEDEDIYAPLRRLITDGRLVLHSSSYVFPRLRAPSTEEGEDIRVLTAMPIMLATEDDATLVCSQPNEIRLRVQDSSPLMADGFSEIDYPDEDVPVRVGLSQLRTVANLETLETTDVTNLRKLEIPLRGLCSYKGEGTAEMTMAGNRNEDADPFVYLVETNDPAYISLDKLPNKTAIENSLLPIGIVAGLSANTATPNSNNVTIVFDKNMKFSEGYYYRVRFAFDEVLGKEVEGYCEGHVVFTIKVVPEYVKWTGADSRNWNNDDNWSRVNAADLLLPNNDTKVTDFTVDGANSNTFAYAPLDFTKVLVPQLEKEAAKGYPRMFTASSKGVTTLQESQQWNNSAIPEEESISAMEATDNIQYDMVSLDLDEGPLAVRPWYANTCEQIHFNHGAELTHQEHFVFGKNYQKAWVDMEMTGDRWYTLASPLQGVVAGDMYTKTATGKQDNELFTPINFNTNDYGRYAPAVYQRGWNKATAKVYTLNETEAKSVAVDLNWSRVYNDVDESYFPGLGFSIRTATDNIITLDKDEDANVTVRFRLPKADDEYFYYTADEVNNGHKTEVKRSGDGDKDTRHALVGFTTNGEFTTTLTIGTKGYYFLAGNPFIATMDMEKFLDANKEVIENAYWIMTSDRQEAAYWNEKEGTFISTVETPGVAAPMQGFFVKAKSEQPTDNLTLKFTPDMIVEDPIEIDQKLRLARSFYSPLIILSALDAAGDIASRAIIRVDADATNSYNAAEDVSLLLDRTLDSRATVYTVASEQALAINSLDGITETEVGLLAPDGAVNSLVFSGVDDYEGLQLLDTSTGQFSDLHDGFTVEVEGSVSGRFYIIRQSDMQLEHPLTVLLKDRTVTVASPVEGVSARIYTPVGMCMGEWSTDDSILNLDLDPGVFIIEAISHDQRVTRKYIVK